LIHVPKKGTVKGGVSFGGFLVYNLLTGEIRRDLLHPVALPDMEGAPPVAMPALNTVNRLFLQLPVVARGQLVPGLGQIIIFIDDPDIQSHWTGLAVAAIDALACRIQRGKGANHGIVLFLVGGMEKT